MPTPESPDIPDAAGLPGLLLVMSTVTVLATAIIAVALAAGSWIMLPVALLAVGLGAVVVLFAIMRALGERDPEPTRTGRPSTA